MTAPRLTLVGEGIENPANARTMLHAAEMFAADCTSIEPADAAEPFPRISMEDLRDTFRPRIAFDNSPGATEVYGFPPPAGPRPAILVGIERRGLTRAIRKIADRAVELPMASRTINCLNVAAAAAVALHYLSRGGGAAMRTRDHPEKHRPETIAFLGAADPFQLGSSIRSACALGWNRLFVEDRSRVWFGCDRVTRSEGRGAARRGRNPIHVIPIPASERFFFDEVVVVTTRREGQPLHRSHLSGGPREILVFPDEDVLDMEAEDWERFGHRATFVRLEFPRETSPYHYRLPVTIALAEAARQIGRRPPTVPRRPLRREPFYDNALDVLMAEKGQVIYLGDLSAY